MICSAVAAGKQSKELRKILRTTVHVPSETYALFPPLGGIIDHLGVAAAKVTLAYRLEVGMHIVFCSSAWEGLDCLSTRIHAGRHVVGMGRVLLEGLGCLPIRGFNVRNTGVLAS